MLVNDSPALMARVPHILKALYEHDVIEEEVLFEWADKPSDKHISRDVAEGIRAKAAPFITWLRSQSACLVSPHVVLFHTSQDNAKQSC